MERDQEFDHHYQLVWIEMLCRDLFYRRVRRVDAEKKTEPQPNGTGYDSGLVVFHSPMVAAQPGSADILSASRPKGRVF